MQKFINPLLFSLLDERFREGKPVLYLMRWLINPYYLVTKDMLKNGPETYHQMVEFLKTNNLERGYNMFVENFDLIIDTLFKLKNKTNEKNKYDLSIFNLINQNRDKVFSEYLPFPNKFLIIFESNELGKFIDKNTINPVNVIRRLSGIDVSSRLCKVKQSRVANSIIDLSLFYKEYFKKSIFSKSGLVRQHVISARAHFTARAVITSLSDVHDYDELHIPWVIGTALFREDILNKLQNRGMPYDEALSFIIEHAHVYSYELNTIFIEILTEGSIEGEYGVPVLFNRNPSLQRGSIQRHRITLVKIDPTDQTIGLSILVLKPYNADFDGDEMAITMARLPIVRDALHNFDVHLNILTLTAPNAFSMNMCYPKPIISNIANWLRIDD